MTQSYNFDNLGTTNKPLKIRYLPHFLVNWMRCIRPASTTDRHKACRFVPFALCVVSLPFRLRARQRLFDQDKPHRGGELVQRGPVQVFFAFHESA